MAFQPSKSKKNLKEEEGALNMNSMMDMMTIILLFLLKSFSTEGALVTPSEQLRLPVSEQGQKPKKELTVYIAKNSLMVNDAVIMDVSEIEKNAMLISPLAGRLSKYAAQEHNLEIDVGKEFTHEVIIQGDEKIPFELLFKVMYTCNETLNC